MSREAGRDTLVASFCRRVADSGSRTALVFHDGRGFTQLDWRQVADEVRRTAAALRRLGCSPGDRVVQLSENRREWIVADLAILMARGVHVPLHATLAAEQVLAQVRDSGASLAIVSNQEQAGKLAGLADGPPPAVRIVSHDPCRDPCGTGADFARLSQLAEQVSADAAAQIEAEALAEIVPADLATIIYTSGTTGEPKGVMLSHANLVFDTRASLEVFTSGPDDLRLSMLPWSHIFARTCDLYTWLFSGATLAIAECRERIVADCGELQPTLVNGVPYFYERLYRHAEQAHELDDPGALRRQLGSRIRLCCSGGAALPRHVAEWFARQRVPLVQGYGLTETSPVITASSPAANRIGSVGRPLRGVVVRIAADGEILTRGPHVMLGYYRNPAATAEVIHDGWFATGDLGQLDDEGYLTITGRKKELIVTASGKNVAPVHLEALLTADPLVHQAIVFGDGRNYLVALIVPDPDELRAEIVARQIAAMSREGALAHPAVEKLYAERIARRLCGVSRHEQIGRFRLLGRAFTVENGELTPTLKLRRSVIADHFAAEIAALYEATRR